MNIIKGTLALTKAPVWIWINQIVSMTVNAEGGAVITTLDGKQQALKETPDEVLKATGNLLKGVVQS